MKDPLLNLLANVTPILMVLVVCPLLVHSAAYADERFSFFTDMTPELPNVSGGPRRARFLHTCENGPQTKNWLTCRPVCIVPKVIMSTRAVP